MRGKSNIKIAIVSHEISPNQGSECAEGWNVVLNLADYADLDITVFCSPGAQFGSNEYQLAIERYFADLKPKTLNFVYIKYGPISRFVTAINKQLFGSLSGIGLPLLYYFSYRLWQDKVARIIKKSHRNSRFDCLHLLTQITYRQPGKFYKLGIPFLWGPTGGSETLPVSFIASLPSRLMIGELARYFLSIASHYFFIGTRNAAKKASIVYAFSESDHDFFTNYTVTKKMVDASCSNKKMAIRKKGLGEKLEIIWIGQITGRKLPFLILDLMKDNSDFENEVNFTILGGGIGKPRLIEALAESNIKNIKICDQIPHHEVEAMMLKSHFLLHTSYREAGTHIVPEALSTGLPVMCHGIGGLNFIIDESNGFKVDLVSYSNSIDAFATIIKQVLGDPSILASKSKGAIEYSDINNWKNMAKVFRDDYVDIKCGKNDAR